jgi:hypothetical protein
VVTLGLSLPKRVRLPLELLVHVDGVLCARAGHGRHQCVCAARLAAAMCILEARGQVHLLKHLLQHVELACQLY